jgi:hypothetical protein
MDSKIKQMENNQMVRGRKEEGKNKNIREYEGSLEGNSR